MTHGQEMVDQTAQGRAVIDFMAREIADAVIDQDMGFVLESDTGQVPSPDELTFVSMSRKPDAAGKRAFRQVKYYIKPDVTSPGADPALDFERPGLMRVTSGARLCGEGL